MPQVRSGLAHFQCHNRSLAMKGLRMNKRGWDRVTFEGQDLKAFLEQLSSQHIHTPHKIHTTHMHIFICTYITHIYIYVHITHTPHTIHHAHKHTTHTAHTSLHIHHTHTHTTTTITMTQRCSHTPTIFLLTPSPP